MYSQSHLLIIQVTLYQLRKDAVSAHLSLTAAWGLKLSDKFSSYLFIYLFSLYWVKVNSHSLSASHLQLWQ